MSLPKSLLFNHSCMYAKRGGVTAYPIVWIGLCLRSVPGVRVLASAVDYTIHNLFIIIKPTRCKKFLNFIFGIKLYMFRAVPLYIIRSFSLYTEQWYMSYRFADSLRAGSECVLILLPSCQQTCMYCCVYSEKFLMMDRGTARNI